MPDAATHSVERRPTRRVGVALWGGAGAFLAGFAAWLALGRDVPGYAAWTNGLTLIGPVGVTLACAPGVLRAAPGRARRAGVALLLASLADVVGQGFFSYYAIADGVACPFPSLADAGYLTFYALFFAGLLMLPWRGAAGAVRGRALLDATTSTVALAAFSWHYMIAPTLARTHASRLALSIALAYPLLDLALCFLALLLLARGRRQPVPGATVGSLIAAAVVLGVADVVFFVESSAGTYVAGGWVDLAWPAANMLVALAGWHLCRRPAAVAAAADADRAADAVAPARPSRVTAFLPYALVAPTVWLAVHEIGHDPLDAASVGACAGAATLAALIMARQVVVLLENDRLYARLRAAFGDLADRHRVANDANDALALANARLADANDQLGAANDALGEANRQLATANERLTSLATTDGMTGLCNHREFQERLREALARSRRGGGPVALVLLDVDHFKKLNDTCGHPAGDAVLRAIAGLLRSTARGGDVVARYGGEEFAIVCPNATALAIVALAERVRAAVAAHAFDVGRPVTVSIGVSGTDVTGPDAGRLIATADGALYRSKHGGRDRVSVATADDAPAATRAA